MRAKRVKKLTSVRKIYRTSRKAGVFYEELCRTKFIEAKEQSGGTHVITEGGHFRLPIPLEDFPKFDRGQACDLLLRNCNEIVGIRIGGLEFAHTKRSQEAEWLLLRGLTRSWLQERHPEVHKLVYGH